VTVTATIEAHMIETDATDTTSHPIVDTIETTIDPLLVVLRLSLVIITLRATRMLTIRLLLNLRPITLLPSPNSLFTISPILLIKLLMRPILNLLHPQGDNQDISFIVIYYL